MNERGVCITAFDILVATSFQPATNRKYRLLQAEHSLKQAPEKVWECFLSLYFCVYFIYIFYRLPFWRNKR